MWIMAGAEEGHIMGKKSRSRNTTVIEESPRRIEEPILRELPPVMPLDEIQSNRRKGTKVPSPLIPADAPTASTPPVAAAQSVVESTSPPAAPPPQTVAPMAPPVQRQPAGPPLLFEIGWEVCWQLGGIYTVLRSKAEDMIATWGDRYFLIGPYNPATAAVEFEEQPTDGFIRQTLD